MLIITASITGALAGAVLGGLWLAVGGAGCTPTVAAAIVAAAIAADLAWHRWARPRPLSIGTQVPQAWGRLLGPTTAATLYGARLGVGPLTILGTWRWWAATLVAASWGPLPAAAAGASYGALRCIVTVAVASGAQREMIGRMAAVHAAERRVRRILVAASLAAAILVLAACDGGGRGHNATTRRTTTTRTASTTTSIVAPVALDLELARALIANAPTGFTPLDGVKGEQPLDLAAASLQESDDPAERALLETRGFERGYQRSWHRGHDTMVATVYQFATADGAAAYMADGLITLDGFGAQRFAVPDVAGATGFSQAGEGASGPTVSHGVTFVRGRRFFLVFVSGSGSTLTPDDARHLAAAQAARA